jgi:hypothetical protein
MLQRSALRPSPCSRRCSLALKVVACGGVLLAVLGARRAHAAEPVRLEWVRLEGAGSCIDAAQLEARVQRRLGTDPFDARASRSIEGVARRTRAAWRAQIAVRARPSDANPPLRELESTGADCESLSNAVVLAVALAIDPAAALSDAPVEPTPAPRPVEEPKAPTPAPITAASEATLAGRANLALAAQLGLLPKASFGVALGVAATLTPRFELGLRAQAFPEVEVVDEPSYATGLAALTLELCGRARPAKVVDLRVCGGPSLGLLHAAVLQGERTQPGERASLAAELGLDAAFALTPTLAFELGARAAAPITRYRFILEGSDRPLFTQSAIAAIAHLGLELRLGEY